MYDGFSGAFVLNDVGFLEALRDVPVDELTSATPTQREHVERVLAKLRANVDAVEERF